MTIKQRKIQIEPTTKLNYDIYIIDFGDAERVKAVNITSRKYI